MKLYQIDAFTSEKFSGNPAGVCLLDAFLSDEEMQNLATEMNLAETAFVTSLEKTTYHIRFFTPEAEVDICGHATLSSAHILFSTNRVSADSEITFQAKGGELLVKKGDTGYTMNFPLWPYTSRNDIQKISENTGVTGILEAYDTEENWILIITDSIEDLKNLSPNLSSMKGTSFRTIIVTCVGDEKYDYYMRCFDAGCGVDEDPVTGSVECVLSQYWSKKLGKTKFTCFQCSQRGGEKKVELLDGRVNISGNAVTVFEIEY